METSSSWSSPRVNFVTTFFSYYISDLPNDLKTNVKLSAEGTSLFTIIKDVNESANARKNDLSLISKWAFNWKMLFNLQSRL